MPTWLAVINAMATVSLAIVALTIARGQLETAKQKLKLDLYDRRWQVFADLRKLLRLAQNSSPIPVVDIEDAADRARFLFGKSVNEAISEFTMDLIRFEPREKLKAGEVPYCSIEELEGQFTAIVGKITPYLAIHAISADPLLSEFDEFKKFNDNLISK